MSSLINDLSRLSPATRTALDDGGQLWIGGETATVAARISVADPSSGKRITTIAAGGARHVDQAVDAARRALETPAWRDLGPAGRERLLFALADAIERHADHLAELETVDVGMPLWMARHLDVAGSIGALRYMAGWPTKVSGRTVDVAVPIPGSEFVGYTTREPVGVIGAIIPWNVPLMLAVWKLAPALAAGCAVILKPSEDACLSVLALARLASDVGFPPGVINVLTGAGPEIGEALVDHPGVDKITFTGSTATGRRVAERAARTSKKLTLELGGKSPQLLFADADLATAIKGVGDSIFLNSGQVCVAGSRLYAQRAVYDEVVDRLSQHARGLTIGAGLSDGTQIGPLASRRQKSRVLDHLGDATRQGATIATDQPDMEADGFYVRPTIVTGAANDMRIVQEEVFGPVLTVTPFDDLDHALHLANDTAYGLSACVWTTNLATAHRVAKRLKSGKVAINTEPMPYPALPEGGRKASGYGRDLGQEAIDSFLETKSVLIRVA